MKKETMKALVRCADGTAKLTDRPVPRLADPRDAIVRVTLSTICTSDLHILHGAVPRANPDIVLGHEFVGVPSVPATASRPTASPSAATAGSAAAAISTTVSGEAGSLVAASTDARRSMSACRLPIRGLRAFRIR